MSKKEICLALLVLSISSLFAAEAPAASRRSVICRRTSDDAISVRNRCRSGETTINNMSLLQGPAGPTGATGPQGPTGPTGPSLGDLVGYALIDQAGAYTTAGFSSATSLATGRLGTGTYELYFTGNFPSLSGGDTSKVVILATARAGATGTANAVVISASATNIDLNVFTHAGGSAADLAGAFVAVYVTP